MHEINLLFCSENKETTIIKGRGIQRGYYGIPPYDGRLAIQTYSVTLKTALSLSGSNTFWP